MFCPAAKTIELYSYFPILYPKRFILCKKAVCNGKGLEVYTHFDFQRIKYSVFFSSFTSNVSNIG